MKKLSKSSIFILMAVIILLQYVSPILAATDTLAEKKELVSLTSAKVVAVDDQTVTVDLKLTADNATQQAEKATIGFDNKTVELKEVVNQTATSKNQYALANNEITAEIAAAVNQEANDILVKVSRMSLKGVSTLQITSGTSTTILDVSDVTQLPEKASSTSESSEKSSEATGVASSDAKTSTTETAATNLTTKIQANADEDTTLNDISQYLPDDLKGSIFDSIILSYKDSSGKEVDPLDFPADGKIDFTYNWSIPNELKDGYQLKDGDYFTFKLPDNLAYRIATGSLGDYADYAIHADHTVTLTFKNVTGMHDIRGTFYYNQATVGTNEPGKIKIDVPIKAGSNTVEVIIKPTGGTSIAKTGKVDKANNPNQIFWDVTINTNGNKLTNAKVSDAFPEGNTYSSVIVYPLTIDTKGNVTGKGTPLVAGTDYIVDASGTVTLIGKYAETYQAFQLSYTTTIEDDQKLADGGSVIFKNTATLTNAGKDLPASAEVTATYGKLLAKYYDKEDKDGQQVFNWHIDYNAGEKTLPVGTYFVDTLDGDQVFYKTPVVTNTAGKALDPSLYVISYDTTKKVMKVTFPNGLNQQIKVAYKSQVTVPLNDDGSTKINNTVTGSNQEAHAGQDGVASQGLVKSLTEVDYTNRVVTWSLAINNGRQIMSNWSLYENIPTGLTVDKTSFKFTDKVTNEDLKLGIDYAVTDTDKGFTITFLGDLEIKRSNNFVFTFKTAFETQALAENNKKWINTAVMNWTDKFNKPHKNTGTADFKPRDDYFYDGSKGGSYNAINKDITWNVYTNLNQRSLKGATISDPIPDDQAFVAGSAKLYFADITKGGGLTNLKEVTDVTPTYDKATKTLSVNLPEGSTTAYQLTFKTSLKDKVIDKTTYTNTATYENDGKENKLNGSASVSNGGNVVGKTGQQDPTDSAYALWSIWVNKAQSSVNNVVVKDVPSSNQSVIEDSIKVYGSTISQDGKDVKKDLTNVLELNKDYSVDLQTESGNGTQVLEIKFLHKIDTAYLIEYRAFINSSLVNDKLTNKVSVSATGEKQVDGNVVGTTEVINNGGSSTAKNVNLVLTKVDQDNNKVVLHGVKFELYAVSAGKKGSLLRTGTTDDKGKITWGNLKSGDYFLVETAAINGYEIPTDLAAGKKITLKANQVDDNNNFQLTQTNEKAKTSVSGAKVWEDNNNSEGLRPASIKVNLLADGKMVQSKDVSQATNWTFTFDNLLKYKDDGTTPVVYTVTEDSVPNYTSTIDQSDLKNIKVTNARTPEVLSVKGTKIWDDKDNQDGIRPDSIVVNLLANGVKVTDKVVKATDNWAYTFDSLPKYKDGQAITYTVTENSVDGYSTTIEGYDLINKRTPSETSASVTKAWDDNNNQDGIRPTSIEVQLYANDKAVGEPVTLDANNNWTFTFTKLALKSKGQVIVYTVKETSHVTGYTTTVDDHDKGNIIITNTHIPELIQVNGTKTWKDKDNQDGLRPDAIKVNLLANGEQIDSKTVTSNDNWAYSFIDLPKFDNGTEITYTITEDQVDGYSTTVDGYDLTNNYSPLETSITVTKSWNDSNDQDGLRPASIKVQLYADGKASGNPVAISEKNNWTTTFDHLDKNAKGKEIVYTVKEVDQIDGYTATIDDSNKGNVIITNTHTPEVTKVSGTKTWDDKNNQDGIRPSKITVNLLADGKKVATKVVTVDNDWRYTFANLPKFNNGKTINYEITEDAVKGYVVKVAGYNLINTHTVKSNIPVKLTDKSKKLPKTSDSVNPFYELFGFIMITIAGFGIFIAKKRIS
uniref:Aggregation promoting factor n=1 Tax=Lactococcus lactis TaxID=1358 RepID=A0A143ZB70_9LACT|nr:aggregation promoting factor [Lactococcus lactis]